MGAAKGFCEYANVQSSQQPQMQNALRKHQATTTGILKTWLSNSSTENYTFTTKYSDTSSKFMSTVNYFGWAKGASPDLIEAPSKSSGLSSVAKNLCRPDKLKNTIGSCKDGQIKFHANENKRFVFDNLISQFIEDLQTRFVFWMEKHGVRRRVFLSLQRLNESVADALLGLDTEQLKKVDLKLLPRSIAYHLPVKTLLAMPDEKVVSLISYQNGVDFLERYLTALLVNGVSVDAIAHFLKKMRTNLPLCQFLCSNFASLLEELFTRVPDVVATQFPKCIYIYLPDELVKTFTPALIHKIYSGVATLLSKWSLHNMYLRRKWFKIMAFGSNKPKVLNFQNRVLLLGMTVKELKEELFKQVQHHSLEVLWPLMSAQPSLPQGHILLEFLLHADRNEVTRFQVVKELSKFKSIASYLTADLIQEMSYNKFMLVFHHLTNDQNTPLNLHLSVAYIALSRFFRHKPRPWSLTVPEIVRLSYLTFALSLSEVIGVSWEERLSEVHLQHLHLDGLSMASRRHVMHVCFQLVMQNNSRFEENHLKQMQLPLLPALPISAIQQLPVSIISNNLRLFSLEAKNMPIHHRIWLLDQIKDDLWLNLGDLLHGDGPYHLIPLLPLSILRSVVSAYLTARKYDTAIMEQARLLPPNILRIWLTYGRNNYAHEERPYSDLAWMRTAILGLSCADVATVNLEDFLSMLHVYQYHIKLRESQTQVAWLLPTSLRQCLKKGFIQYKQMLALNPVPPDMVLTDLTAAEAQLLGGQILAEFGSIELSLVPRHICRLVFQLIGSVNSQQLLTDPSRCALVAQSAVNCLKIDDQSLHLDDLQILGSLAFCVDPSIFRAIESTALQEFLTVGDVPYMACLDESRKTGVEWKLKAVFGTPQSWDEEVLYSLSGLLFIFEPGDLFQINLKALQGLTDYLIAIYQPNHIESFSSHSEVTSFPLFCSKAIRSNGMKQSIDTILLLANRAMVQAFHSTQETALSCGDVLSVGAAAVAFTIADFDRMAEFEFGNCTELFGKIAWSPKVSSYIWQRLKWQAAKSKHLLTEEGIVQLNKLSVLLEPPEIQHLNFTFPQHMDLVAMLGQQQGWSEMQVNYLGKKWIQDNPHKQNLSAVEMTALNNILCGMPLKYLVTTPSVLRHSLPILSKLELCSEDHLKVIFHQVVSYDILGSPLLWDDDDLQALGILLKYARVSGNFPSSAPFATSNSSVYNQARNCNSVFFELSEMTVLCTCIIASLHFAGVLGD